MKTKTDPQLIQERLRLALEAVSDGIWDWDLETGEVYWNPLSYTMLGYEPDEFKVTYDKWKEMVHPDDICGCENSVQDALTSGEIFKIEFRIKCKDGSWKWMLGRGRCVSRDKDGNPIRMVGTHVDLTQHKKDEVELHKNESELKAIYENAPLIMLLVDQDRRVLKMNGQALEFSGRSLQENVEIRGGEALRCVHAFDDANGCGFGPECKNCGVRKSILETFETGKAIKCREAAISSQSGEGRKDINLLVSTKPLEGFEKKVVLVCIDDITDRKQTENELRAEKEFTEAALDSQGDTFFLFDPESGKPVRWNKALCDVTGYTDSEIAQLICPYSYFKKEDFEKVINFIRHVIENGSGTIELDLVCKDGHSIPFEYGVSAVKDSCGRSEYLIAIGRDITKRKATEKQLLESESVLSASFSSIQDGIVILDNNFDIIRINPVIEKWCDGADRVVGAKCYSCFRDSPEPCDFCPTRKALESGNAEFKVLKGFPGSGVEWLEVYSYPIKSVDTGEITGVIEFLRDISDRKRSEEALLESENKLREAQQMAQLGHWHWDVSTGEVEWSEWVYKIFGLNPDEFTPTIDSVMAMSPWPEDHQRDKELIQKAIESHEKGEYEQKFLRLDGSLGYYYSTFQGVYDQNDQLVAIKGTVQDITERKLVEQELLRERDRLEMAQEAAGFGMFDWDLINNKTVCSDRYFQLFGLEPQDKMITREDWLNLVHPEDRERVSREVRHFLENGDVYDTEYRVVWPDGSVKWLNSKSRVFSDECGKPYRMIGIMSDITERKQAEEVVKTYNSRLKNEVKERTEELQEKNILLENEISERIKAEKELKTAVSQLIQAEKLATVGQLAAGVAHEINTPLGAIGSSNTTIQQQFESILDNIDQEFEILKDNANLINQVINRITSSSIDLNSRQARQMKTILTERLTGLNVKHPEVTASLLVSIGLVENYESYLPLFEKENSTQIIDFVRKISNIISGSKIIDTAVKQSSRVVYALRDYARADQEEVKVLANIKDTIETAIVLYGNRVKHGIDLKVELDDNIPEIECHPHELCQVWTNLISNAVHAMNNCGSLSIRLRQVEDNIQVTIADSGCGIPDEIKGRIFDPLFTTKPVGEGTGLGLDIVKRIIERHNGTLQLESQVGVGTTFTITIPITG